MVGPGERAAEADPGQPAVGVNDPVRPREQPVGAGEVTAERRAEGESDRRSRAIRQNPAQRNDDRLVADRARHGRSVDGDRSQLQAAYARRHRGELDAVDRPAGSVAHAHGGGRRYTAIPVVDGRVDVIRRDEPDARSIDCAGHDGGG